MSDAERAREYFAHRAWASAHEAFTHAARADELDGDDLERFAVAAYLIGRDDEYIELLGHAHHTYLAAGAGARAARAAFWLGLGLLFRGERGQAGGWFGRAQRLLEREEGERVEAGYLLLAEAHQHIDARDLEAARASIERALAIGERFSDADLVVIARHLLGRIRLQPGKVTEGLSLLDEAMLAAASGELSPVVTGLVYCSVIDGCREVYALGRAGEWTSELSRWCEEQPEMVAFTGICSVHRAEFFELHGAWSEALGEAERAATRCLGTNAMAASAAFYLQGEVRRLRGEFAAAEAAYRRASAAGREPQPGLSLLRLAQGDQTAAVDSIRRALDQTKETSARAVLLPACVEILLAEGALDDARRAGLELGESSERFDSPVLHAAAEQARGAIELAAGDAPGALEALGNSWKAWQELDAPYPAARVRVLMAKADGALGDADGEKSALAAARREFKRLGAAPELAALDALGMRRAANGRGTHARRRKR